MRIRLLIGSILATGCVGGDDSTGTEGAGDEHDFTDNDFSLDEEVFCDEILPLSTTWHISPAFAGDPPLDFAGKEYWQDEFELDNTWRTTGDLSWVGDLLPGESLAIRRSVNFEPYPKDGLTLSLSADDGLTLYLNEQQIGVWGGNATTVGCVNRGCANETVVDPINMDNFALTGVNTIAMLVSNAADQGSASLEFSCPQGR